MVRLRHGQFLQEVHPATRKSVGKQEVEAGNWVEGGEGVMKQMMVKSEREAEEGMKGEKLLSVEKNYSWIVTNNSKLLTAECTDS